MQPKFVAMPKPLLLFVLLVVWAGCRRDPALEGAQPDWVPTPLELDIPAWAVSPSHPAIFPPGNPLTVEGVALGRRLFYEKALSDDYSMSCASCHRQEHAFNDPRRFSVGTDGSLGRRNAMSVQNVLWDHDFFWDGRAPTLEAQALGPVRDLHEMRNSWPVVEQRLRLMPDYPELFRRAFGTPGIDSMRVVRAIAQFERTLLSFGSPFDRYYYDGDTGALTEQQIRGMQLVFGEARCSQCHMPPLFMDHEPRNNGLPATQDAGRAEVTGVSADRGRFKVASLRNIAVSAPYMHDGRFATLADVVGFYAEGVVLSTPNLDSHMIAWVNGEIDLDPQERADLVSFMEALTDPAFLADPAFADPH
jgi:cytochrome c peroxidase